MWEDPVNASGSELRCVLSNNLTYELYNSIWEEVITDLVTRKIPHVEDIAGIRIFDRSRGSDLSIRLDIWLKISDEKGEKTQAIKGYLEPNVFKRHGQQPEITFAAHK
jgi:Eukaryotic initiation factor 4E